jgi:signal transduction histidine kinase
VPSKQQEERGRSRLLEQIERMQSEVGALEDGVQRSERLISLGLMAGLIAHEFNNIMTPILAYVQMALRNPEKTELSKRALSKTLEGATRAAQVAQVILDMTRNSRPGPVVESVSSEQESSVKDVARATLQSMEGGHQPSLVRFCIDIEPEVVARIAPAALQTVLLNLILNAQGAMLPIGGTISIASRLASRDDVLLDLPHKLGCSTWSATESVLARIVVADTGRGMAPFHVAALREQAGRHPATPSSAGLGLAVCRGLVESAGGFLGIESVHGLGTTCTVVLPGMST